MPRASAPSTMVLEADVLRAAEMEAKQKGTREQAPIRDDSSRRAAISARDADPARIVRFFRHSGRDGSRSSVACRRAAPPDRAAAGRTRPLAFPPGAGQIPFRQQRQFAVYWMPAALHRH